MFRRIAERRLAALEAQQTAKLSPLDLAYALVKRQVPYERWPDAAVDAFLAEPAAEYLRHLPDDLLDAILARPGEEARLVALQAAYGESPAAFAQALADARQGLLPTEVTDA